MEHPLSRQVSVCFLPFWEPHLRYASSRLRALFPARTLASHELVRTTVGWTDDADVYLVVQLCSDRMLGRLRAAKSRGAAVVYVVCDRHFAQPNQSLAGVNTKWRFGQLADLADAFLVPTYGLKKCLNNLTLGKLIHIIPDSRDYIDYEDPRPVEPSKKAAWFGNPGTGNFAAARPFLRWLAAHSFEILIISRRDAFNNDPEFAGAVTDWNYETLTMMLRRASFSVIAFDESERHKSENRLVTSVMNGVPAIVSGRSESAKILVRNGLQAAVVKDVSQFAPAIKRIQNPAYRTKYLSCLQAHFMEKYSDSEMTARYISLFRNVLSQVRGPVGG